MAKSMLGNNEKLCDFTRGPLTNLFEKLNGENGDIWLDRFNVFLRGNNPFDVKNYTAWKSITIGVFGHVQELQERIYEHCYMGDYGKALLKVIDLYPLKKELKLYRASLQELGFRKEASLKEILAKAKLKELGVCPPETGPYLRTDYMEQLEGEKIAIAMEPLPFDTGIEKGVPSIFMLENNKGSLTITGERADSSCKFKPNQRFLFVRRWNSTVK